MLYHTLAVGHHTGVLDCFEPRLSVPVNVFHSLVDALPEGRPRPSLRPSAPLVSASSIQAAVPSLLEAPRCAARRARFSRVG